MQVLNLNRWTAWEVPLWPFNASERFGVITVIITQLYTQVLVSHGPEVSVTLASFFSFFCFFLYTHTHTHTHTHIYMLYIYSLSSCWQPSILADTCGQASDSAGSMPSPRIRCALAAHAALAQLDYVAFRLLCLVLSILSPTGFLHFPLPVVYHSSLEAQKTNSPNLQK